MFGTNMPTPTGTGGCGNNTGGQLATYNAYLPIQQTYAKYGQLWPYVQSFKIFMCPADKPDANYYLRNVYISSYVWNGAIVGYGQNGAGPGGYRTTFKLTQFKPDAVLEWEADEQSPFFFNDASSYPDEGISSRHGKGATLGQFGGTTVKINVKQWYDNKDLYAGALGQRGAQVVVLPNRAWCNPGKPRGTELN